MNKIIKLNSKQGTFDTTTKKLCDFTIPRGAVYNLKKSFINCNLSITTTDTNTAPDGGNIPNSGGVSVYNVDLGLHDDTLNKSDFVLPNVCLVKNCHLSSQTAGKIDDIRRVDNLKQIHHQYEKDINQVEDASYYSLSGATQEQGFRNSPFVRYEKTGTEASQYQDHNVKIMLHELFDFCNEELVDCNRLGDLSLHLEMNFDKLRVKQEGGAGADVYDYVVKHQKGGGTDKLGEFDDVNYIPPSSGTTMAVDSLTTKTVFSVKEFKTQCPYYVNQKLAIAGTVNGTPLPQSRERIITGIDYSNDTGKITLTFDTQIVGLSTAGNTFTGVSADGVNLATSSISINKMELVLEEVVNPQNVPDNYVYYSYDTEEDNHGGRLNVKKNYLIDSNCMNVYLGFGEGIISTLNTGNIDTYRFSQDNVDMYDRDVNNLDPLHYENISRVYMNNDRELRNIKEDLIDRTEDNKDSLSGDFDALMTTTHERDDNQMSVLGVEIACSTAGVNQMRIFQEKKKVI
jgi:hypothetical protein